MKSKSLVEKVLAALFVILFAALAAVVAVRISCTVEGDLAPGVVLVGVITSGTILIHAYAAVVFAAYVIVRAAKKLIRRKIK